MAAVATSLLKSMMTTIVRRPWLSARLQMARCLEHGLLVPQDSTASIRQYRVAADLGSAEACLRCGIHAFEGTGPGGALQGCAGTAALPLCAQPYVDLLGLCILLTELTIELRCLSISLPDVTCCRAGWCKRL
jgi:hypothetical protein